MSWQADVWTCGDGLPYVTEAGLVDAYSLSGVRLLWDFSDDLPVAAQTGIADAYSMAGVRSVWKFPRSSNDRLPYIVPLTVTVMNQLRDIYFGDIPVNFVYLGERLIWQRQSSDPLPGFVTRGLSTILLPENIDIERKSWTDTIHGRTFTDTDAKAGCMTFNGLNGAHMLVTLINESVVDTGFTLYLVTGTTKYFYSSTWVTHCRGSFYNASDAFMDAFDCHNPGSRRLRVQTDSGSARDFTTTDNTRYVTVIRQVPNSTTIVTNHNGSFTLSTADHGRFWFGLENNSSMSTFDGSALTYFAAAGAVYHSDEEVAQNVAWITQRYL